MCGVWCLWCVCVVFGVCAVWCVLCVAQLGTRKPPVCGFKTPPCGPPKTCACVQHAHVLHVHTEAFFTGCLSPSLSPLLLSFSRPFLFLSSFVLFSLSFSAFFSFVFPLSNDDNDHSSSRLSLSLTVNTALTCLSVRVRGPWPIPCWPNMFASCMKQLSWHDYANLVPLGMKLACICAGNG